MSAVQVLGWVGLSALVIAFLVGLYHITDGQAREDLLLAFAGTVVVVLLITLGIVCFMAGMGEFG